MNKTSILAYFLFVKYISNIKAEPTIRAKLRIVPTPKYIKKAKEVIEIETINPRLVCAINKEKVKKFARNNTMKNSSKAPLLVGSSKPTIKIRINQKVVVMTREGKKPFLFFDSSL